MLVAQISDTHILAPETMFKARVEPPPGVERAYADIDTGATGSSNMGHEGDEYGTNLSDAEKKQLIEYLKTL